MNRSVESCPFRESSRITEGLEAAACRLLGTLTGLNHEKCQVRRDACEACCVSPVPSVERINPVIASFLSKLADDPAAGGDAGGLDQGAADALRLRAQQHLQIIIPQGDRPSVRFFSVAKAPTVAVVIPCHNYGRFLGEAIDSVLRQSFRSAEIFVVDDASDDDTEQVVRRYAASGVRYHRVEFLSSFRARRAGLELTQSEFVCFLDADDVLPADYLESGLEFFRQPRVGIVYSDAQLFGLRNNLWTFPEFANSSLELRNICHAGSLVRRRALEIAAAFDEAPMQESHCDWFVWRRVLDAGWLAVKQPGIYGYRRHADSMLMKEFADRKGPIDHFRLASAKNEHITIFTPFSGRAQIWERTQEWFTNQTWPHDQCRLIFMDTSGNEEFGRALRRFLAESSYTDTRYISKLVGVPGLADLPRPEFSDGVRLACARIYNRMAREVTTRFTLVVEDDIVPPLDAIEQLLRAMDPATAAVSGAYRSRYTDDFVAWDDHGVHFTSGSGIQEVGGSGFGCILLRRAVLIGETFGFGYEESPDYDWAFSRRLRDLRWKLKVAWQVECEHLE